MFANQQNKRYRGLFGIQLQPKDIEDYLGVQLQPKDIEDYLGYSYNQKI